LKTLLLISCICFSAAGQSIRSSVGVPDKKARYVFYLHGGVVTVLGNNAINQSVPEWGPYEYLNILDSLRKRGFQVISENRREGIHDSLYARKLKLQVDTLLGGGVKEKNILIIGASAGWNISLHASSALKNKRLKFVIMGGCWPETYKEYEAITLYGKFLSIIETTDPHGTCQAVFDKRKVTSYEEIKLNMGLSHGFIYKGYREWIDPAIAWFEKAK